MSKRVRSSAATPMYAFQCGFDGYSLVLLDPTLNGIMFA